MSAYIDYVKDNYSKDFNILEIGAGHRSTKAFSEYFKKIYSIEHDPKFCNIYHDNYINIPVEQDGWYNRSKFNDLLPLDYDLIIFDGPKGGFDFPFSKSDKKVFRSGFCDHFTNIKKDVDVIIDDTDRNWHEKDVVEFFKSKNYQCIDKQYYTICRPKS